MKSQKTSSFKLLLLAVFRGASTTDCHVTRIKIKGITMIIKFFLEKKDVIMYSKDCTYTCGVIKLDII